jgi:membrane protein implicated in regulation of membrane protease activity
MVLTYVFAMIVGLGILGVQAVMGSKELEAEGDLGADKDFHFGDHGNFDAGHGEFDADHAEFELESVADLDHHPGAAALDSADHDAAGHDDPGHDAMGFGGLVALFLSTRFWIFASLGFGMTGTLLSFFSETGSTPTLVTAITMGIVSGLSAALTFRALRRTASAHAASTDTAVGQIGRVLVPCEEGEIGQIRIELRGQSVDVRARTDKLRIERGERVIIEMMEGDMATVSRAPDELQEG